MNCIAVLGYSRPLRPGARKDPARVAKRLARSGAFLAVRYEEASQRLVFLRVPERIAVPGPEREESRPGRGQRVRGARPGRRQPVYRKAGNRIWRGSIRLSRGGTWSGRIEVPPDGGAALLTVERKGKGAALLPKDAALVIPEGEAEDLLALLNGLFARARRAD